MKLSRDSRFLGWWGRGQTGVPTPEIMADFTGVGIVGQNESPTCKIKPTCSISWVVMVVEGRREFPTRKIKPTCSISRVVVGAEG